jgi:type I restriction-modification system DNA methylase subunit
MKHGNGAPLGFEASLFQAADKLRKNMGAGEYKHVALGLAVTATVRIGVSVATCAVPLSCCQ